ncbi:MAG: MazG nucleotide pyrophosphohydrolase domain-containing protein [Promethearchaeota archaeon]
MDLGNLTEEVDMFIQTHGGYWKPAWLLAAITEELGELSHAIQSYEKIRQIYNTKKENSMKKLIEEESGDILFALICLTNFYNINLESALIKTLGKYSSRER